MKKMRPWMGVFCGLLIAMPSLSADWEFSGSQRMATFWDHTDYGKARVNGEKDDDEIIWNFQANSTLEAKVKAEKVKGHIELGLRSSDGGDQTVDTRRAYGSWKFMEDCRLVVGKDYSPIIQFTSGQVFDEDLGLAGIGTNDGFRPGQIRLELGGFQLSAITPYSSEVPGGSGNGEDPDEYLPKLEASYTGQLDTFTYTVAGGFQYLHVDRGDSAVLTGDLDVYSYILGLELGYEIAAAYIKAAGGWGQNWTNANWNSDGYTSNANAGASINAAGDDVRNTMSWQAALILGYKFFERLSVEAGAGYRSDDNQDAEDKDTAWSGYLQAVITVAPGVYIVPEIGYFDYMDDPAGDNEGYEWYAGAKWQIDF